MMMDTAVQQPVNSNGQSIVTTTERQALIQKLALRWPLELSKQVENQAFEKTLGIKPEYGKQIQLYFQKVQTAVQNRANQQQQLNNIVQFQNHPQPTSVPIVNQIQHPLNQLPRFPVAQQIPRLNNPQMNLPNQMTRLREPQKFAPTPMNTLSYSQSPASTTTTTIDLSQGYSSPQMSMTNPNDYSTLQPRYSAQPIMNMPRQRAVVPTNNNFQPQPAGNNSNDILHQFVVGNAPSIQKSASLPMTTTTITTGNTNNSSNGDQLLQRILSTNIDGGIPKPPIQNRQTIQPVMSQPTRTVSAMNSNMNNSTSLLRTSLSSQQSSPSASVVVIPTPTPTQTSTVQIQPSSNITIQQSPLSNSNGPFSANSQTASTNSSTPVMINYSSPTNRTLPLSGTGSISFPDDEVLTLIKSLKDNVNRLQLLSRKYTNENNTDKVRQVHFVHQQILQFIHNPTYESLANAKNLRDMLDRIPSRLQQPITTTTTTTNNQTNVFNQCLKATNDFLLRDPKERIHVTKRYLEPLSDVINGVPHKMMRLDVDNYSTIKIRSSNETSLLSSLNNELSQLPEDVYAIERIATTRTRKINNNNDDEVYSNQNGIILRCKLLEKLNPLIPSLRLYIPTSYPEQSPEILSLTKTVPPRLEFTDEHPFFELISSIFVSHLFKLRPQHSVTDILNIWRFSVQTAL